ncbi:hypothetical protein KR018_009300, partial [Drosophila ironensis]
KMSRNCRACGKFIFSAAPKNLFDDPHSVMLHHIEALTGLFLLPGTELEFPACICAPCEVALREAIRFRERVILTQKTLQSSPNVSAALHWLDLNETGETGKTVETGETVETVPTPTPDEEIPFEVIEEQEVEILEEVPLEGEIVEIPLEMEEPPAPSSPPIVAAPAVTFGDSQTTYQPRIQWNQLNEEETVAMMRERRKRDCICEQCGRHFSCPSNFKIHLLRHSGVKNFACDQCPFKFYTAHLLRRHQMVHTNERPFTCKYCPMAFNNVSGRIQHERVRHSNLRPYKCSECGKNFALSGKLRAHMLTHKGVRSFHCDSCKVSFMRRSHLIAHLRSKSHAQNAGTQEAASPSLDIDVE